ncbi:MAG: hypothetical protein JW896_18820 [Deltaproteobacteria bacterium]|nr:hypothetical protein [Deltaproteobacteria bacterium]
MTLSPIPKVLSTFLKHHIKAFLIGGQACHYYLYLCKKFSNIAMEVSKDRLLISLALSSDMAGLQRLLKDEEDREKEADRQYWEPLRKQLEEWRLKKES